MGGDTPFLCPISYNFQQFMPLASTNDYFIKNVKGL